MRVLDIPAPLQRKMLATHGVAAQRWLEVLPGNLARLRERWRFTPGQPFPNLSYAYVAAATLADGSPVVFKAQPPHMESLSGTVALRTWNGRGSVRLLDADAESGFELLERVYPGTTAEMVAEDEATLALLATMPSLWVDPPDDPTLITMERWAKELFEYPVRFGETGPLPLELVVEAAEVFREMIASSPSPKLLHGDLHHSNILSATRAPWLAIDPKGLLGDPAFEPSAMFFNPRARLRTEADIPGLVRRRLDLIVSATGLDRHRVAAWGFAQATLSVCWSATAGSPVPADVLDVARALRALM